MVARDALRLYFVLEEVGLDSLAEGFKLAVREIVDRAEHGPRSWCQGMVRPNRKAKKWRFDTHDIWSTGCHP